jgi:hypothetical protein
MDRVLLCWLSRLWSGWRSALLIVQPETIVRWHRQGFKLYWSWKSRKKPGRPKIDAELRNLIHRMSQENPTWGAPRILSELLLPGHNVAESTVDTPVPCQEHSARRQECDHPYAPVGMPNRSDRSPHLRWNRDQAASVAATGADDDIGRDRTSADFGGPKSGKTDSEKILAGQGKTAILKGKSPEARVAQLDRASVYGTEGYRFDSCRAYVKNPCKSGVSCLG